MCTIILDIGADGVNIAANRDEMADRPWDPPGPYWPGIFGGRDATAGGTWMALNRHGVMAAVLNRPGTLGALTGKRSRGELPLLALAAPSAREAATAVAGLDAGRYRACNLVLADRSGAYFLRLLGKNQPDMVALPTGVSMITSGEPNDMTLPRIARHLPRFANTAFAQWGTLLADRTATQAEQLCIPVPQGGGFGTLCASLVSLPKLGRPCLKFAAGPPDRTPFLPQSWGEILNP